MPLSWLNFRSALKMSGSWVRRSWQVPYKYSLLFCSDSHHYKGELKGIFFFSLQYRNKEYPNNYMTFHLHKNVNEFEVILVTEFHVLQLKKCQNS